MVKFQEIGTSSRRQFWNLRSTSVLFCTWQPHFWGCELCLFTWLFSQGCPENVLLWFPIYALVSFWTFWTFSDLHLRICRLRTQFDEEKLQSITQSMLPRRNLNFFIFWEQNICTLRQLTVYVRCCSKFANFAHASPNSQYNYSWCFRK